MHVRFILHIHVRFILHIFILGMLLSGIYGYTMNQSKIAIMFAGIQINTIDKEETRHTHNVIKRKVHTNWSDIYKIVCSQDITSESELLEEEIGSRNICFLISNYAASEIYSGLTRQVALKCMKQISPGYFKEISFLYDIKPGIIFEHIKKIIYEKTNIPMQGQNIQAVIDYKHNMLTKNIIDICCLNELIEQEEIIYERELYRNNNNKLVLNLFAYPPERKKLSFLVVEIEKKKIEIES